MTYSSYAGSLGMWTYFPIGTGIDQRQMSLMNGAFQYIGMPPGVDPFIIYGGALKNTGGVYSCSCPAWRNQSSAIEKRTCKHLRRLRGDAAEEVRTGGALPQHGGRRVD